MRWIGAALVVLTAGCGAFDLGDEETPPIVELYPSTDAADMYLDGDDFLFELGPAGGYYAWPILRARNAVCGEADCRFQARVTVYGTSESLCDVTSGVRAIEQVDDQLTARLPFPMSRSVPDKAWPELDGETVRVELALEDARSLWSNRIELDLVLRAPAE